MGIAIERLVALLLSVSTAVPQDDKLEIAGATWHLTTDCDLKAFLRWVKGLGETIVAIEGSNALNRPLEKALREAEVLFYSFQPADTDKFRKASWRATGGCGLPMRSFNFSPVATRGSLRG